MGRTRPLTLRYTPRALAELSRVLSLNRDNSPESARRVGERIQAVIELLASYPRAGQATDVPTLRKILARPYPYLIFYEARETEIVVIAVRHAARDPGSMPV